ncbi:MAG: hypothetical protein ACJASI_002360 [Glaciecola sp.]|jgi:hypothetical protein
MLCCVNATDITMYDLQKSKPASDKQSVLADFNHVDAEHYG